MLNTRSEKLFVFNFAVLALVIFGIYLSSPLRPAMEKPFYAIKSYLSSFVGDPTQVVEVTIDENDIASLENAKKDISYDTIAKVVQRLLADKPKTISVLLHTQVFRGDDPKRDQLFDRYAQYSNIFFGVFDFSKEQLQNLSLDRSRQNILPAGISRNYREETVKSLPAFLQTDLGQYPYLISRIAKVAAPEKFKEFEKYVQKDTSPRTMTSVALRYYRPNKIKKISLRDAMSGSHAQLIKGANVIIGYGVFRNFDFRIAETTFANTPFQFGEGDLKNGMPLVEVVATGVENLVSANFIRDSSFLLKTMQVALAAIFCWAVWGLPVQWIFVTLFMGLVGILFLQSLAIVFFSVDLPTADVAIVGFFVTFMASLIRAKDEITKRLREQESVEAQARLLELHKSFLGNMSVNLVQTSKDIGERLEKHEKIFADSAAAMEAYGNACTSAQEFENYLNGIQLFLDVQMDEVVLKVGAVDLAAIVQSILRRFSDRLEAKRQEVDIDLQIPVLQSDVTVVDQILHNLISNSIKYSPDESKIKISSSRVDEFVYLSVEDQGIGVAEAEHEKIFEKFYRVKDDNVYKIKGSGLGLYLCRYFARHLGGDVIVESEKGRGSKFTLKLRV